jgi:hypothetical protein
MPGQRCSNDACTHYGSVAKCQVAPPFDVCRTTPRLVEVLPTAMQIDAFTHVTPLRSSAEPGPDCRDQLLAPFVVRRSAGRSLEVGGTPLLVILKAVPTARQTVLVGHDTP